MPTSRTTKQYSVRKPVPKKSASPKRTRKAPPRAKAKSATRARKRPARRRDLPGWSDLAAPEVKARPVATWLDAIPTGRLALLIFALAAGFTLYVGHVHATQDLLAELEQARRDNLQLHLKHNRLKGDFDRATGPAVIYQRAEALGLEEGFAYAPTIRLSYAPAR